MPVLLFTLLFGLDLLVFFLVENLAFVGAWMVIGIFPKACICSFGHHHQHLPTFHQPIWNRCLEIILGFQTGTTGDGWFLHHVVGHHQHYKDQALDESRWQRDDGSTMGELEYATVVFGTSYLRAYKAGARFSRHRRMFVAMTLLQVTLLFLLFFSIGSMPCCSSFCLWLLHNHLAHLLPSCGVGDRRRLGGLLRCSPKFGQVAKV